MILYFSATGNTKFIAKLIAEKLGDECVDLLERIKKNDNSPIHSEKPFVICTPVYVCEMPRFLSKFLKNQEFTGSRDVYCIFTSGGYIGIAGSLAKGIFRRKKMNYKGQAEFVMPRNYIISDHYALNSPEEIQRRIEKSRQKTGTAAESIKNGQILKTRYVFLFEKVITLPFNPVWVKLKQQAKDFYTTDKCTGCGKCAKLCPLNNIRITNKRPEWIKSCAHCMACICNCPVQAIEYGEKTQSKDRYNINKYL